MKVETWVNRLFTSFKEDKRGCWVHQGVTKQGYGVSRIGGKYRNSHRLFFELVIGPVPKGFVLDHLCRNRACRNPTHLEIVTERLNILRGNGAGAVNARKSHCINGHEFTLENTYPYNDYRSCRKCMVQRTKKWRLQCRKRE